MSRHDALHRDAGPTALVRRRASFDQADGWEGRADGRLTCGRWPRPPTSSSGTRAGNRPAHPRLRRGRLPRRRTHWLSRSRPAARAQSEPGTRTAPPRWWAFSLAEDRARLARVLSSIAGGGLGVLAPGAAGAAGGWPAAPWRRWRRNLGERRAPCRAAISRSRHGSRAGASPRELARACATASTPLRPAWRRPSHARRAFTADALYELAHAHPSIIRTQIELALSQGAHTPRR
jgi:hypothetical protein